MSEPPSTTLGELREAIDAIDGELIRLMNRRAGLAQRVAEVKRAAGEGGDFYRPGREAEILRRVRERNPGPLPDADLVRLIRELMSSCLALEQPLSVAYLGPEGTFTHEAALKHFGHAVTLVPQPDIDAVFREVEAGSVQYGVVPVENSTEGVVTHTADRFLQSPLLICGEVQVRVQLHLLSRESGLASVREVLAHPQALAQSRRWLDVHLPGATRQGLASNALAAQRVASEPGTAAVASVAAGERYGLQRLAANIEDEPGNTTRFLVIGGQAVEPTGADRTSLVVRVHNRPGALHDLLTPFASHGISLTRIESRPSRRSRWDYVFFVDLEGHQQDAGVAAALAELEARCHMLRLLGSYPRSLEEVK